MRAWATGRAGLVLGNRTHRLIPSSTGAGEPALQLPTGGPLSPMPHRAEGRLLLLRLDGLLAALAGCFAHFPHGTFALSGSEVEI